MKAKREHRVPLCRRALEILGEACALGGEDSRLVFTRLNGKPLIEKRLRQLIQKHRIAAVRQVPVVVRDGRRGRITPERWSKRRWRTWSRTRWKPRTGVPTSSSVGVGSWTTGRVLAGRIAGTETCLTPRRGSEALQVGRRGISGNLRAAEIT